MKGHALKCRLIEADVERWIKQGDSVHRQRYLVNLEFPHSTSISHQWTWLMSALLLFKTLVLTNQALFKCECICKWFLYLCLVVNFGGL